MKNKPKKVYILSENKYKAISYDEFITQCEDDKAYKETHFFIMVQGMFMEVSKTDKKDFKRTSDRYRYLQRLDKENELLSIDAFDNEDDNGIDFIKDLSIDIEQTVINNLIMEKLNKCLHLLSKKEQILIDAIFFKGLTEREYSKITGIPQKTISDRKQRIIAKLKKYIEN